MRKILISTGGTGGHVIPAEVVKEHLNNENEIYYSTDLRGLKYLLSDKKLSVSLQKTLKDNFATGYNLYLIKKGK